MIKAVLFDLDGTLIDSAEAIVQSFMHTFETLGLPAPDRNEIIRTIGAPLTVQLANMVDHDLEELLAVYREHYFATSPDNTFLLPGVRECLTGLSDLGLKLGIATSKGQRGSNILLNHLGVRQFFDVIIGSGDVEHHKPAPEALLRGMEALNVSSHELFYVGDTPYDTEASRRAAIRCLGVSTGYATHEALLEERPEYVYSSMDGVYQHIINAVKGLTKGN
jgi:phosphoglycolate phosphatase-like HAD superfamily hydrolase